MIAHAGLLARWLAGAWRGVLIEGASGAGKSDLMLRAIDAGWSLVADDRTVLWRSGGRLYGKAPRALAGLIELRGLGVVGEPWRDFARVELAVHCRPGQIERMPALQARRLLGADIPRIDLVALEASGPAKLARALTYVGLKAQRAYQADRAGSPDPAGEGDP